MRLLDNQRKTTVTEKKDLEYIDQHRKIYRRVIQEAKKKKKSNYISSSKNKLKAAWQIINKELGKSFINNKNTELRWGKNKISNPRATAELFNSYFVETIEKLTDQSSGTHTTCNMINLKINTCPQTMFINPVSENKVEKVVKKLKGKSSSGFGCVMDPILKKCVQFTKKPLTDICNTSFASGIFLEILKTTIVNPCIKREYRRSSKL
jgi:L-rhamnose mutarotase